MFSGQLRQAITTLFVSTQTNTSRVMTEGLEPIHTQGYQLLGWKIEKPLGTRLGFANDCKRGVALNHFIWKKKNKQKIKTSPHNLSSLKWEKWWFFTSPGLSRLCLVTSEQLWRLEQPFAVLASSGNFWATFRSKAHIKHDKSNSFIVKLRFMQIYWMFRRPTIGPNIRTYNW